MIHLSRLLRKVHACYEWGRKEFKLNNLLFWHYVKLFGKSDDQIDSLVQAVFTFSKGISMEFDLTKRRVVIQKKGKLVKFDGIRLNNQKILTEVDENGYPYLDILELDEIQEHLIKGGCG